MALCTPSQFETMAQLISQLRGGDIGFDFETNGLSAYKGARAFIMGFTDPAGQKYSVKLDDSLDLQRSLHKFFSNKEVYYCAHNIKFEMSFLEQQFGIEIRGHLYDSMVNARIERNNHMTYGLQACALRIGESKYQPMLDWLKIRGNKDKYHLAPEELIIPYVEQDAWLSWRLRQHQRDAFRTWDASSAPSVPKIQPVVQLERKIIKPLFRMESRGLLIDVGYCRRAAEYEKHQIEKFKREFQTLTSTGFVDSRQTLEPIFNAHGISYGRTDKGNASFTEENLRASRGHPVVAAVLGHRHALKRLSSYWENFLEKEHNGILHPNIHQNKAQTGRMSISDPSAQNWSTDEDEDTQFPIRRAFIARDDCYIASLDYKQMELRKGADEAEDLGMCERLASGADLHQEVADIAGVKRSLAKNGRFAKQYGAGVSTIAETLGVSTEIARTISDAIDKQAPKMAAYSYKLSGQLTKKRQEFITDWFGRRFYFDRGFEYKAFNYRIQGGCAEILKAAILKIDELLESYRESGRIHADTFLMLVVHDELVLNVYKEDLWVLTEIKRLMIDAHSDKKVLAMDVNVELGPNFYDLDLKETVT